MASFVIIGIIFSLHFVVFQCEGKVSLKSGESVQCVSPGENVEIEWQFDTSLDKLSVREWEFEGKRIARILVDLDATYEPSNLPRVEVVKPAKLILRNVDSSFNGTYSLQVVPESPPRISYVHLFIAAKGSLTVNCTESITVNETNNVICLSKSEGGNPLASVTWYKDDVKFGESKDGENVLALLNISRTDAATYKCESKNCELGDEKVVKIDVNFPPTKPTFDGTPNEVALGTKDFVIKCQSDGQPKPSIQIFHDGSNNPVSTTDTYTIGVVDNEDDGLYDCNATNALGTSSTTHILKVVANVPTSKQTIPPTSDMTMMSSSTPSASAPSPGKEDDDDGDGPSIGLIVGIVIGALVLIIIIVVMVWWCKSKEKERGYGGNVNPSRHDDNFRLGAEENQYESVHDGNVGGRGPSGNSNPYETPDRNIRGGDAAPTSSGGDAAPASSDGDAAPANSPPVYATVNKPKKTEPTVTYATLDTIAMQPNSSRKRDDSREEPTNYASIQFKNLKGDVV